MASLMRALDQHTPFQVGDKGHLEYGWSHDKREKILQFYFQLVRMTDVTPGRRGKLLKHADPFERLQKTSSILAQLLQNCQFKTAEGKPIEGVMMAVHAECLQVLYKLIGQTRDILEGKGEYTLAYMQLVVWHEFYPDLAQYAFDKFLQYRDEEFDEGIHAFGSWKDVKYLCDYCSKTPAGRHHPLINYACTRLIVRIREDAVIFARDGPNAKISLAARWTPRESSKRFGWLSPILSALYFPHYLETAKTLVQKRAAHNKCKMEFRKLVAALNRHLDTVQIKQCDHRWREINHATVTSVTLHKQKQAFMNVTKKGVQRSTDDDRVACAGNFKAHVEAAKAGVDGAKIRGKRVGLNDLVKAAIQCNEALRDGAKSKEDISTTTKDTINLQWQDNASQTGTLGPMVAMCDVSGSMEGTPLHSAIGLSIRVAEKSVLGRRVMTFSAKPEWVNLDGVSDFTDCVERLQRCDWGFNTNFNAAMAMILEVIVKNKMAPEDVENLILAIFSDMQIDGAGSKYDETMFQSIARQYHDAGMQVHGRPYAAPHLLFWNLRPTTGFPSCATEKNTTMMSGFSPALLNLFVDKGLDALKAATPWNMMVDALNKPRYEVLDKRFSDWFLATYESSEDGTCLAAPPPAPPSV